MRTKSIINSIGILLLAIAAGAGITWWIYDRSQDDAELVSELNGDQSLVVSVGQGATGAQPTIEGADSSVPDTTSDVVSPDPDAGDDKPPEPTEDPQWDERIRSTLTRSDLNLRQKSQQLLDLASDGNGGASVEQRLEALDHGLNLVDDEDYEEDALSLALRSDLPTELGETIITDLHGRDPELLVDTCQKIAAMQDHPLREEAAEIVNFLAPELSENAAD